MEMIKIKKRIIQIIVIWCLKVIVVYPIWVFVGKKKILKRKKFKKEEELVVVVEEKEEEEEENTINKNKNNYNSKMKVAINK